MIKNLKNSGRKGVTLLELIIVFSLITLVVTLGYSMFVYGTNAFVRGTGQSLAQQNARIVNEHFTSKLRNAGDIVIAEENPGGYNFFQIIDNKLYHNGELVTSSAISDIEVKITEVNQVNGIVKSALSFKVTNMQREQVFVYTNQLLLNNIGRSFEEDYSSFRSINNNQGDLKLFYSPGFILQDFDVDNPIDFLINNEMAVFASDSQGEVVKILGSTGVSGAIGTNATSFYSFRFGNIEVNGTIYLDIDKDYHVNLPQWEDRGYNALTEVVFNNSMYISVKRVYGQPGTDTGWVRFAPLTSAPDFPVPDETKFPLAPNLPDISDNNIINVIEDSSPTITPENLGEFSGELLYFPNATSITFNYNVTIEGSVYAPKATTITLNSENTIKGFIHAPNARLTTGNATQIYGYIKADEINIGTGNIIHGFIHSPNARLTTGNGTDILGYIYVDGSEIHTLTGTSVNGTIYLSNVFPGGNIKNFGAEFRLNGNRNAVNGHITNIVSNGTNIVMSPAHINGVIYAPNASVSLLNSSSIRGSVVARTFDLGGGKVNNNSNLIFNENIVRSFPANILP